MSRRPIVPVLREGLERYATGLGLVCVAAGAWLRLRGLGDWALNPDEGIYRAVAGAPEWSGFLAGVGEAAHPPLYFWLLRGVAALTDGAAGLRAPAAVFGALSVLGVFLLCRRALGPATAVLAAAAFALAPGAVEQAQLVRPYALQCALLAFGWWGLFGYLERGGSTRWRPLAIYGGAFALALLTHYGSAIALAATLAWLLLGAATGRVPRANWAALRAVNAALLGLMALLFVLHVRPYLDAANPFANTDWLAPFLQHSAGGLWLSFVGVQRYLFGTGFDGTATLLVCVGFVTAWRRRARPAAPARSGDGLERIEPAGLAGLAACAVGLAALLAGIGVYPFGGTRHAAYLFVLLVPLAAEGVRGLLAGQGWRLAAGAAVLALALAVPALPAALVGAPRLAFGAQVERLATPAQLAALPLARLRDEPVLVLLDEQAFYFLQPFFGEAVRRGSGPQSPPGDSAFRRYAWGRAELVVARSWVLRTGTPHLDEPDHFAGLLHRARAVAVPRDERPVWLVSGGWAPLAANRLAARGFGTDPFVRPFGGLVRVDSATPVRLP